MTASIRINRGVQNFRITEEKLPPSLRSVSTLRSHKHSRAYESGLDKMIYDFIISVRAYETSDVRVSKVVKNYVYQ